MAYATDRRASSPKRDSDVMKTKWPAITKTAYSEAFAKADEMDAKLRTLCQARLKMGQAMLALGRAMRSYKPCNSGDGRTGAVYNELRKIDEQINKAFLKFPLELK